MKMDDALAAVSNGKAISGEALNRLVKRTPDSARDRSGPQQSERQVSLG